MRDMTVSARARFAHRAFSIALGFLLVVAILGSLLRLQTLWPLPRLDYSHLLHAHSHVAILGWVFNAFYALALVGFIPSGDLRFHGRMFVILQVAVVGMLCSFPFQGYGPASIAFSTLHMSGSALFAWKIWRSSTAVPSARGHLRVALIWLVVSGLGPLALGPLVAAGLRDTVAYRMAIYFYLHAQYNGWFLFFLQALVLQAMGRAGLPLDEGASNRALRWLGAGSVLTLAQSTLWLEPPLWLYIVAGTGGAMQLVGCGHLLRGLCKGLNLFPSGPARWLACLAAGAFLLKNLLQTAAAWPGLTVLANHRFTVIAFLHLVFLGIVTPIIFALALRHGWLRDGCRLRLGLSGFVTGVALSETLLVAGSMAGLYSAVVMFWATVVMAAGVVLMVTALRINPSAALRPSMR